MKKYYILLSGAMLTAMLQTQAQTKIGGTGAPDGSAMLEVTGGTGNNKGILPPRLTTAQRDAITLPAKALMIYNTTTNQLQVNTGTPAAPIWTVATQANAWSTVGNAGTNPATNFIGTTDNQSLVMRTNALERVRVDTIGRVGIGTSTPIAQLDIRSADFGAFNGVRLIDNGGANVVEASMTPGYDLSTPADSSFTFDIAGLGNWVFGDHVIPAVNNLNLGGVGRRWNNYYGANADISGTMRITGSTGTPTTITGRNAAGDIGNVAIGSGLNLTGGILSATPATPGWALSGNAGTNPASNYIGTSDAQPLVLRTNAAERMRVLANGNVGIGTAGPAFNLHVSGNTGVATTVENTSSALGEYAEVRTRMTGTVPVSASMFTAIVNGNPNNAIGGLQTTTAHDLVFRTGITGFGPVERMRLDTLGNVGINTNDPQRTLHVQGGVRITGSNGTASAIMGRDGAGDISNITLGSNLSLSGGVLNATAPASGWGLTGNAGTNPASNYIGTADAQPLVLRTNAAERMRVLANGNVGIGTATPAFNLHVSGNTGVMSMVDNTSSANGEYADVRTRMTGTVPAATSVFTAIINGNPNNAIGGLQTLGANDLVFRTGNTGFGPVERMRLDTLGNVGINTNDPQRTLHVQGGVRITGSVGTPTAIMGRDGAGDINNLTLGTGLTLTGGVLSASPATSGWALSGNAGSDPNFNYVGTADGQPLIFRTNATERMRMQATGNIGIGTNNPTVMLDVDSGDIALTPTYKLIFGEPTDERIFAHRDIGYNGANLFLESRENIGFIIDRNNTATNSNTVGFIWATNTSWEEGIPQELMRLTDAGNLGLGIAAPNYKLDVAGDINASGSVRSNGVALTSDVRLKRNINNTEHGLSTIMKLNPVEYEKKNTIQDSVYNRHEIGFIAQEVAKVLPSLVTEGKDADKTLAVSYTELIPVLTKAMQEQQLQIDALKAENQKLKTNEVELKENKAVTAQLMERVKQMEQMMGIKEIEGTSKVAGK